MIVVIQQTQIEKKKNEIGKGNFLYEDFDSCHLQREVPLEENDFVNVRKVMDVKDISAKKCIYKKTTTRQCVLCSSFSNKRPCFKKQNTGSNNYTHIEVEVSLITLQNLL